MTNSSVKIYFPNGFLQVGLPDSKGIKNLYFPESKAILLENPSLEDISSQIDRLLDGEEKEVYLTTPNPGDYLQFIASRFKTIEAAGGIVENEKAEVLFIYRRGKWDLPKGKIDDQESPEKAALREIEEETGAKGLTLLSKLCNTYHVYNQFGENVLKTTHWFLMQSITQQKLTPQTEEDISELKWFHKSELKVPLGNSYPTIADLVEVYLNKEQ